MHCCIAVMSTRIYTVLLPLLATLASARTRLQDVIYMKAGGTAFTMDLLKPAMPNGAAVVSMVSGGWISDHSMLTSCASRGNGISSGRHLALMVAALPNSPVTAVAAIAPPTDLANWESRFTWSPTTLNWRCSFPRLGSTRRGREAIRKLKPKTLPDHVREAHVSADLDRSWGR